MDLNRLQGVMSCHDSALCAEPDGRVGLHRAGGRAGPEGQGEGHRRAGDRRQPVSHARRTPSRRGSWRSRRTRPATARAWGCPISARRPPGSSRPSSATRSRPRTSWSPRGPSRSSSISPRRCSTPATACWSSARSSRRMFPTSSAEVRGPCWRRSRSSNEFRPSAEDVRRFLASDPRAAGDHS